MSMEGKKRKISENILPIKINSENLSLIVTTATNRAIYLKKIERMRIKYLDMVRLIYTNLIEKYNQTPSSNTKGCITFLNKIVSSL